VVFADQPEVKLMFEVSFTAFPFAIASCLHYCIAKDDTPPTVVLFATRVSVTLQVITAVTKLYHVR